MAGLVTYRQGWKSSFLYIEYFDTDALLSGIYTSRNRPVAA